ncbi:MAG: fibronectin type III domain-containing protein, partial [Candidatus Roizmanbacteria bacterium]|nr:fibronectin type III domain-containing protein [Candidatus Roizmanbacteria bacterium]
MLNVAQYPGPFTPPAAPFNSNANTLLLYHFDATGTQNVTDSSSSGFTGTLGLNAWGLEATDPNWTGDITASPGSEVGAPQSAADTTLSLEPLPEGSWAGSQVSSLPYGVRMQYGATTVVNNDLYVLRGNNTTAFYKQDITTGTWTQLTDIPLAANYGSAMEWDGADAIYVIRGNVASTFYKYTISTNTWSAAIDQPIYTFSYGASITRIGNMFYIAAGGNGATMLSFNKNYESTIDGNDAWSTLQSAPYNIYYGAGIAYDGNNTLWLVAGNGTGFAKYSISADTWDTTVSAPVLAPYFIGYSSNNAIFRNNHIYTFTSYDFQANGEAKHFLWSYDIATDKWEKIDNATEFWAYTGATAYDRSRYVYLVQGYGNGVAGNTTMVRYDLELNKYLPETPPLPQDRIYEADGTAIVHQVSTGTSMAYDGNDYIYMIQGSAANTVTPVNRYQVSTKRWTMIPNIPCSYSGGAVYAGNKLYAVCGNGTKKSYSYDPLANEWTMLANNPGNAAETITSGGSQIAVYNGTDALYVLRGGTSNTLYKYTIGTNTWTTESTIIPGTIGPNYGASITYDGSRYLYVMRGNNTGDVYRYDTSTPGWTTLTSVPETVSNGSGSVLSNGKIYVTTSYNNNSLYMYDIATNSWQSAPLAQSQIAAGGTLVKGPGNSMYALQGNTMFTFWKYNLPSATSSYKSTGNYISRTVDLGKPYAFSGLTATVASPSATSIGFETRTSTDATTWSSWAATSDLKQNPTNQFIYKINSPVARYMQTRVTMNSEEGAATPTVSDMSIEYYQDTTAPTNPSGVIGYTSATKSATITDSIWYNHNHPYFEWTGSTDGNSGSGVGGYYVYFGTDSAKIASISGVFTSQANYTATLATDHSQDGFYYLNVQAVDVLGNIAAPTTSLFTYRYIDTVSPNNPNVISAFADNTKIASLSAAGTTWYNYARPYFEWSGATDDAGGSGVAGYYVYFGTNQNALASQSGTFQTGTSYNPTMQTDGSDAGDYYLNIQTRDAVGNVAASNWTSFHYKHIDRVAPTNPNALGSYADITKLNPLTPGGTTWYNYAHPYFEWTGATDEVGGSGIAGYYVYFGTNPNAVASQSGVFQTGSTYSPTMQTDGSDAGEYYLIIQSKDTGGNSATSNWNAFHYKHSDSVPPNNPNNISGYSDITKITSITEGTWYNYAHPYFEWTGATDDVGGSGIAGYYVYFGTNPSAVASQSGVFQLGSTYSPTMQTNGSDAGDYYLIIQSKDTGGNAAASNWTAFHYNHIDVTAPTIPTTLSSYTTASKSAVLSPDIYYNNSSPYFEWTGATDEANGSGIAGYYVYFGSDPYGVASTSGTFVTQPHFTASLATNSLEDGDHYLIIQTKDTAGNISYGQWKPFHYVYDHTPPTVIPSENVAVLPNGYTSVNNYRFIWDATDDPLPNGAGVGFKGYYYKTGTGSGALSQDIFTTGLTVTGITAYQEGINTFLIRAADNLGNYSNYTTVNYYFNSTAPSAPKNLSVDVSNAGANKFNFVWDEPATYKGTMKEYRYSVNEVPNAANISTASGRLVNNIKGTHDGTNTFYVVGVDDAYNVNYGNYASKTFSVSVSAPGIPLAPEAFDNSIRTTAQYRVGLTWDPPTDKGTAFDRYEVYASETKGDCSVAMTGYTLAGSTAGTSYVATSIGETNLSSKAYYFCILACATTNQCSSPSTTVTMTPSGRWLVAPDLVGSQSATVKTKSALVSWNTSRSSNSFVKYGKSSGSYSTEVGSSTQASYHEINITGLDPGTTYYYQMLWTDEDGNLGKSTEKTFSTNPAPFVSAVKFSRVNINSAQVTFTIKSGIKATIQYGKTLSYGSIETI